MDGGQREVAMDSLSAALVLEQYRQAHGRAVLFLSIVAAVLTLLLAAPAQASAPVRIGVLNFLGSEAAFSDWSTMLAHLEAALPERHFILDYYDVAGLREAVRQQKVDFVVTNGGQYVALEAEFGVSRIATLESPGVPSPS
ncbi:MAG: PhnD/SsuA/transferrin family substrate-binding protein, partial [Sulfuriferula sp.]